MPSFRRQVDFAPTPVFSRLPRDDESYVMKAFSRHASHCFSCANPYEVHRQGGTLCLKGHQRAVDVAQYVYNMGGKAYSLVDRKGNQQVQIEIPAGCEPVRSLLKAMERGLRILKTAPSPSFDKTYQVVARPVGQRQPSYPRKSCLEPAEQSARMVDSSRGRQPSAYVGRGSLFAADMREREQYYSTKPSVFYRVTTSALPIPARDYGRR